MKQLDKTLLTLLLAGAGTATGLADYVVDFNDPIDVSDPNFIVAPHWGHVLKDPSASAQMEYEYLASGGVADSGALKAGLQDEDLGVVNINNYLITAPVKGKVTIMAKDSSAFWFDPDYAPFIHVYSYNTSTGTVGTTPITTISNTELSSSFQEITLAENLEDFQCLALCLQGVTVDNFTATSAKVSAVPSFEITDFSPKPGNAFEFLYFDQAEDGSAELTFTLKIHNNGETDLAPGDQNYSVSLYLADGTKIGASAPVSVAVAQGEESDEFTVTYNVSKAQSSLFNSYPMVYLQTDMNEAQTEVGHVAINFYGSEFAFVHTGASQYASSLIDPEAYGLVSAPETREYEIRNNGVAPLQIVSITYPEGFSSTVTEFPITVAGHSSLTVPVTLDTAGEHEGNLVIVYKQYQNDNNESYSLGFSGSKTADGLWLYNFNGSDLVLSWPAGSMAESAIFGEEEMIDGGIYDFHLKGYKDIDNLFFTPRLHAEAGDTFKFDIRKFEEDSWTDYPNEATTGLKVYIASDRSELGEPKMEIAFNALPTAFETKTLTFDAAGDYYVVFQLGGVDLDNLFGLKLVETEQEIFLEGYNIPTYATQNINQTGTLTIRNLMNEIAAGDYTLRAYIDGELNNEIEGPLDIPARNSLKDEASTLQVSFRGHSAGTYPVYFELSVGDYTITTESIDVTFAEETAPIVERYLSGTVTDDNLEPVEGATVTLISADGADIRYSGQTDENGEYSILVNQYTRRYNVEVSFEDKEDFENDFSFADDSVEQDFMLYDVIHITDDADHTGAPIEAVAYLQKALSPGYNAVTLPLYLTADEIEAIFGEDAVIYEFNSVMEDAGETTVKFSEVLSKEIEAGQPYLVYIEGDEARDVVFKTKGNISRKMKTTSTLATDFLATDKPTQVGSQMYVLNDDNFVSGDKARTVTELPAYSGYIKSNTTSPLYFTTDGNYQTSIKDAEIVEEGEQGENVIYDLNGVRVKNPEKGIYIINGKAVRVK